MRCRSLRPITIRSNIVVRIVLSLGLSYDDKVLESASLDDKVLESASLDNKVLVSTSLDNKVEYRR